MKIAILGTSNGVLKDGYSSFFPKQNTSEYQFHNFSLGGNCSIYASYKIDKERIVDNFDFCVLDFCINDENYVSHGCLTLEQSASYLFGALCKFHNTRCVPLLLVLSNKRYSRNICDSAIVTNALDIAKMLDVETINFAKLINDFHTSIHTNEIYRDEAHYSTLYQQFIADSICYEISKAQKNYKTNPFSGIHIGANLIKKLEYRNCLESTRGTSLVQTETRILESDSEIFIDDKLFLCGLLYWSNESTGAISISNSYETICKYLQLNFVGLFIGNFYHQMCTDKLVIKLSRDVVDNFQTDPTQHSAGSLQNSQNSRLEIVDYCTSNINLEILGKFILNFVKLPCKYTHISSAAFSRDNIASLNSIVIFLKQISYKASKSRKMLSIILDDMNIMFRILANLSFLSMVRAESYFSDNFSELILSQISNVISEVDVEHGDNISRYVDTLKLLDTFLSKTIDTFCTVNVSGDYSNKTNFVLRLEILNLLKEINPELRIETSAFDESAYLESNQDVAMAVKNGNIESGFVHWITYGIDEGRKFHLTNARNCK